MRVFLAGASGAIGRRMVPLLRRAGHTVVGSTRSIEIGRELERAGVVPAVLDVFDAQTLMESVCAARPEVIVHQLTDLPRQFDAAKVAASSERNARIRIEGTRNLLAAAQAAAVRRFIVQSIAFAYVPGGEPHPETDPLDLADPTRAVTVKGAVDMERQVLEAPGMDGIVLRYGLLYGPGTWSEAPARKPGLHVDAAAQAALLALTRGAAGVYNIADDDGAVSIAKARAELGFDPSFRIHWRRKRNRKPTSSRRILRAFALPRDCARVPDREPSCRWPAHPAYGRPWGSGNIYGSLSPFAVLAAWRAVAARPTQYIVKFAEFRVPVATVVHQEREQRAHSFNICAVDDGSALARPAHESGARQDTEMRRQCVLGAADLLGDRPSRQAARLASGQ